MLKHILSQPDLTSGSVKVMTGPVDAEILVSVQEIKQEAGSTFDGDDHCAESQSFYFLGSQKAFAGSHEAPGKFLIVFQVQTDFG